MYLQILYLQILYLQILLASKLLNYRFQISMYNPVRVEVRDGGDELDKDSTRFIQRQNVVLFHWKIIVSFPRKLCTRFSWQVFRKFSIFFTDMFVQVGRAVLHDHKDVNFRDENAIKFANVGMSERLMGLHLQIDSMQLWLQEKKLFDKNEQW